MMALEELLINFCKPGFPEIDKISFNIVFYLEILQTSRKTTLINRELKAVKLKIN